MSFPASRQPSLSLIQGRGPSAPYSDVDFMTQEQRAWSHQEEISPTVILETPRATKPSGRHAAATPSSRALNLEASKEPNERAENVSLTPQANSPAVQPSQIRVEHEEAAAEQSPAPDADPLRDLDVESWAQKYNFNGFPLKKLRQMRELDVLLESWAKRHEPEGGQLEKFHQRVIRQAASYFRPLEQEQSDQTYSQRSSTGFIVDTIEEDPNEEYAPTASSRQEQSLATPDSNSPGVEARPERPPKKKGRGDKSCSKTDLKSRDVNSRTAFKKALKAIGMENMMIGGETTDLCDLASKTIRYSDKLHNDKREFVRNSLRKQSNSCRVPLPFRGVTRVVTEQEGWQIMFNLVAYIFHTAQEQVPTIVSALAHVTTESSNLDRPFKRSFEDVTELINKYARQEAIAAASDGSPTAKEIEAKRQEIEAQISDYEQRFENGTRGIREWAVDTPLKMFYTNYDKFLIVKQYAELQALYRNERSRHIFELMCRKRSIPTDSAHPTARGAYTPVLEYIRRELYLSRVWPGDNDELTTLIEDFEPSWALQKELGDGVLLLLGNNTNLDLLNKLPNEKEKRCWYHEGPAESEGDRLFRTNPHFKLRRIAMCLHDVDQAEFGSRLAKLFTELERKILNPALKFREGGPPNHLPVKEPPKKELDELEIGQRLDFLLGHMDQSSAADPDADSAEIREEVRKRKRSSDTVDDDSEGRAKRRRDAWDDGYIRKRVPSTTSHFEGPVDTLD